MTKKEQQKIIKAMQKYPWQAGKDRFWNRNGLLGFAIQAMKVEEEEPEWEAPQKTLGKFNLLKENICKLKCDCGWNLWVGGEDKEDLEKIKKYLREYNKSNKK